jgi:hypothetical protein
VLDYMVTSNHVHLLVKDTAEDVIARSMQLIAGRPRRSTTAERRDRERFGRTDHRWSESIAVGSESFVVQVKIELGLKAQHRQVAVADGVYTFRKRGQPYGNHFYGENWALIPNNAVPWQTNLETTEA